MYYNRKHIFIVKNYYGKNSYRRVTEFIFHNVWYKLILSAPTITKQSTYLDRRNLNIFEHLSHNKPDIKRSELATFSNADPTIAFDLLLNSIKNKLCCNIENNVV